MMVKSPVTIWAGRPLEMSTADAQVTPGMMIIPPMSSSLGNTKMDGHAHLSFWMAIKTATWSAAKHAKAVTAMNIEAP